MIERHLHVEAFEGYELVDSGNHEKLERFGEVLLSRPDTQAVWTKAAPEKWIDAKAIFVPKGGKGEWEVKGSLPEAWPVRFGDSTFLAKLTAFKHVGLFPEQAANWAWAKECIEKLQKPKVLNLFGYTGAASIVAAKAGAEVTHVDSSKSALSWTKENAKASGLSEDALRYMLEDARSFVKREARRGAKYEGIIFDPPAFGRGSKDEVWKIEENLLPLIETLGELLSDAEGSFFLLNGYAAGYAPLSFAQLVASVFPEAKSEFGELRIQEASGRALPSGMYVRFVR